MTLRGVLLDLDGTVYHDDNPLPGAPEAVGRLRDRDLSLCFFSNNPLYGGEAYVDRLQSMGVDARPGEACSSAVVTREYVDSHHADDDVFVIGSPSIRDRIDSGNADVVGASPSATPTGCSANPRTWPSRPRSTGWTTTPARFSSSATGWRPISCSANGPGWRRRS